MQETQVCVHSSVYTIICNYYVHTTHTAFCRIIVHLHGLWCTGLWRQNLMFRVIIAYCHTTHQLCTRDHRLRCVIPSIIVCNAKPINLKVTSVSLRPLATASPDPLNINLNILNITINLYATHTQQRCLAQRTRDCCLEESSFVLKKLTWRWNTNNIRHEHVGVNTAHSW